MCNEHERFLANPIHDNTKAVSCMACYATLFSNNFYNYITRHILPSFLLNWGYWIFLTEQQYVWNHIITLWPEQNVWRGGGGVYWIHWFWKWLGRNQMTGHYMILLIKPYLRVYQVENYVIHHHVVVQGGSRSKNYWHHLLFIPQVSTV